MVSVGGVEIFQVDTLKIVAGFFYIVFVLLMIGVLSYIAYIMSFKTPIYEFIVGGDGNKGYFINSIRQNKAKWNKQKTSLKFLKPLFNKGKHVPPKTDQIYGNGKIIYFNYNGVSVPGEIRLTDVKGHPVIIPEMTSLNAFQIMARKENAIEFTQNDFWTDNKTLIVALVVAICCLIAVGFTVYMTYNFATGGTNAMNNLADQISKLGVVQSVPG